MRTSQLLAATTAAVLLPASAALAHPAFDPNVIPLGEPVDSMLVVPHGCAPGGGMPDGDAEPTVQFDLGHTDRVTVEARDVDGWSVEDDGEAIVWSEAGGATTEPIELPVTLTVAEGGEGDQLFLPALQTCRDGSTFRWVATPGEEGDPAVRIELTSGGPGSAEVEDEDHEADDMDGMAVPGPTAGTSPGTTGGGTRPSPVADTTASDDGGGSGTLMVLVAVVVAVLGGAVVLRARRSA